MMKIETPDMLMELVNGFRLSRIILTAYELKVFDHLDGKSCSSADLASLINTDKRATDRLMNVLTGLGLLDKKHGLFTNSAFSEKYMVSSSPAFLGGLGHTSDLWRRWNTLTEAVCKGTAVEFEMDINKRGDTWLEAFIAAMHARAVSQAEELATLLDLEGVNSILDVGGGSGAFSFALLKKNPQATAVIFDLPNVEPITRKYISRYKLDEKAGTARGNYLADSLGSGFDMVLMFAIIHINDPGENELLIQKGADALNPGGQLVIMDHLMSDDRTQPFQGAVFAINMLVGTPRGDTYTVAEISSWMKSAGLEDIRTIEAPSGSQYIIGTKP